MTPPSLTASYFFGSFITGAILYSIQIFGCGWFGWFLGLFGIFAYGLTLLKNRHYFTVWPVKSESCERAS